MAIYEIFEGDKGEAADDDSLLQGELFENLEGFEESQAQSMKDRIMSTLFARIFFFLLLLADLIWGAYVVTFFVFSSLMMLVTAGKNPFFKRVQERYFLSLKRFFVCGISLFVALFSPALGVMFACTYFLMYDKKGIDEIVPGILQAQFKEFFSPIRQ